jgi:hypothetical protein
MPVPSYADMTRPTRIWFNRGFSLAPIARAMRAADPAIEVYASVSPHATPYPGPTETWTDGGPDGASAEDPQAYAEWVRQTIAERSIDIFVPTRRRKLLGAADLPCHVHLPASLPVLELLDDKFAFAQAMAGEAYHLPTYLVQSSGELSALLADWPSEDGTPGPCVKPRQGVNGLGFWRLMDVPPMAHLQDPERRRIRPEQYLAALRDQEQHEDQGAPIEDIVVMPYLPGPEISFDILAHQGRMLKYAARTKLGTGSQHIVTDHPLAPIVRDIVARFVLHGLVNLQFRRAADDSWKLLEINARPAGGVVYADEVGCGLVADWGGLLTGRLTPDTVHQPDINTHVAFTTVVRPVAA